MPLSPAERVKGLARHVMRAMGRGHTERVYHECMMTAVRKAGLSFRTNVPCPVMFMGECVGCSFADLVLDGLVIEFKAVATPPTEASPQLQKYLASLSEIEGREYAGMVINFNSKLGVAQILEEPDQRAERRRRLARHAEEDVASLDSLVFRRSRSRELSRSPPPYVTKRRRA